MPLAEEVLRISKRTVETGRVRVSLVTETVEDVVRETLRTRRAEVERVPVGREVSEPPQTRQEGDVLVIPVVEEILVVERRLVLREEIHLRFVDGKETVEQSVQRRVQRATVERVPEGEAMPAPLPVGQLNQHSPGDTIMIRTITAMFDDRAHAEAAVQQLMQELNIGSNAIKVYAADTSSTSTVGSTGDTGFWASLKELFVPDEDRTAYAEGVRRGAVVLSAQVEESSLEPAMDILEHHGAVDLDSREAEWREEGWTGYQSDAVTDKTVASSTSAAGLGVAATDSSTGFAATPVARTAQPAAISSTSATQVGGEEVIPIVEERILVGKRDVERGRVRVRSYVVETPVTEQVTLREEHVDVQRRAVDRPVTDADRLFQERTIEAVETNEEAVVAKEARVTEELVVRKGATEHTETVHDTVRHTEVEVDNTATDAAHATTGTAHTGYPAASMTDSNPPGTAATRALDNAAGTDVSGARPDQADGTPGNPPGTMASRAADKTLGTNISGTNPDKR